MERAVKQRGKWLAIIWPILAVSCIWFYSSAGSSDQLVRMLPNAVPVNSLETPLLYFYLHLFAVIPVFCLSFDRKVHYYRSWKALFKAISLIALIFIAWDVFFTKLYVWGFNEDYFAGYSIFLLPVEEWLFFITIPFASIFIYECLNAYFPKDWLALYDKRISISLVVVFIAIGLLNTDRIYTSTTFIWSGGFLLYHYLFYTNEYRTKFYRAYLVSLIPFFIVNGVLTGAYTAAPVVMYDPGEIIGIRIGTVPLEDTIYSFLLLFSITALFEFFRSKRTTADVK